MVQANVGGQLWTIRETAQALRVSRSTVYRLLDEHALEALKVRRTRRVVVASVLAYIARQQGQVEG